MPARSRLKLLFVACCGEYIMRLFGNKKKVGVAVVGSDDKAAQTISQYVGMKDVQVLALVSEENTNSSSYLAELNTKQPVKRYNNLEEMLTANKVQLLEFAEEERDQFSKIDQLARQNINMVFPHNSGLSGELLNKISGILRSNSKNGFVMDQMLFHPLVEKARILLREEHLGELQMMRVKIHVGRNDKNQTDILSHALFSSVTLIESLFGSIKELFTYKNENACITSMRFESSGRYGVFEAVYSDEMMIPPGGDYTVEMTGTDGILWLQNLFGTMRQAPHLVLKRKGLTTSWDDNLVGDTGSIDKVMREHIVKSLVENSESLLEISRLTRAEIISEASAKSQENGKPVKVELSPQT